MKWRVMLELVGPDATVGVHEVGGRAAVAEFVPQMIGLTLACRAGGCQRQWRRRRARRGRHGRPLQRVLAGIGGTISGNTANTTGGAGAAGGTATAGDTSAAV